MSNRKRKQRQRSDTHNNQYDLVQASSSSSSTRPDHSLFIVAHEADIIRGPQAARSADALEVGINVDGRGGSRIGDGLIKCESSSSSSSKVLLGGNRDAEGGDGDMWVDRYVLMTDLFEYTPFGVKQNGWVSKKNQNSVLLRTLAPNFTVLRVQLFDGTAPRILVFYLLSYPFPFRPRFFECKTLHRSRAIK